MTLFMKLHYRIDKFGSVAIGITPFGGAFLTLARWAIILLYIMAIDAPKAISVAHCRFDGFLFFLLILWAPIKISRPIPD